MVAAEDEAVARAAENRLHAAAVRLDACGARVPVSPAVNRAPEVCVELEVRDAPLAPHRREQVLEMFLHLRVRAVEYVPGAATPAAEGDFIRAQRLGVVVTHEPVRML